MLENLRKDLGSLRAIFGNLLSFFYDLRLFSESNGWTSVVLVIPWITVGMSWSFFVLRKLSLHAICTEFFNNCNYIYICGSYQKYLDHFCQGPRWDVNSKTRCLTLHLWSVFKWTFLSFQNSLLHFDRNEGFIRSIHVYEWEDDKFLICFYGQLPCPFTAFTVYMMHLKFPYILYVPTCS